MECAANEINAHRLRPTFAKMLPKSRMKMYAHLHYIISAMSRLKL